MTEVTSRLSTALADRYRIERHLGEGGMAAVYLAQDLKHDRQVAVKVLRPELAAVLGHERFIQEIKTTANLQHPHILPLFDSGEVEGFLYYVMPFVEGETLREKLNRETQLSIDESVRIATEVADALDYAHRHGVIHRDIKPENILLHDGRPMVADFGIALAVSAAAGGRMTETGLSLGTPHYMSPEQATAEKELTPRSDVYSLGCVLYEMLTGEPPHTGGSAQAIVMKIVMDQARPVTDLRQSVPTHVAAATAKALQKLAADRFESAKAFVDALRNPGFSIATTATAPAVGANTPAAGTRDRRTVALTAFAAVATVAALWGWFRPQSNVPAPVARYQMTLNEIVGTQGQFGVSLALSPDGSNLVYVGPSADGGLPQLWLRPRDQLESTPIVGSTNAHQPFFAPDGRRVAFISIDTRQVRVVSLGGEPPVTLVDSMAFRLGGAWGADGYVYYSAMPDGGLARVPESGGAIEILSTPDPEKGESRHAWPDVLPNGKGAIVTVQRGSNAVSEEDDIGVVDFSTGQTRVLVRGLLGRYTPTGHLVFVRFDGAVMAIPFDQDRLEVTGAAVPVFGGVAAGVRGPDFALSTSGRVVYLTGTDAADPEAEIVWVDRLGRATPLEVGWTLTPALASGPVLSPDGTRLAVSIVGPEGTHVWVKEIGGGPPQRLTFEGALNNRPRWAPDGQSLTFLTNAYSASGDLAQRRVDGVGGTTVLLDVEQTLQEGFWSSDGAWLIGRRLQEAIFVYQPDSDSAPRDLFTTSGGAVFLAPRLSPDGRWLAYASNESGRSEVYVRPFPDVNAGGPWQVSANGGYEPVWSPAGDEIFYKSDQQQLVAVSVLTAPTFAVRERTTLFPVPTLVGQQATATYDVSRDAQRFLLLRALGTAGERGGRELVVIENWFAELGAKMNAGGGG